MKSTKSNFLLLIFVFLLFSSTKVNSQSENKGVLYMGGLIYGYNHDPQKRLFKKEKQIELEGLLDKVNINLFEGIQKSYTTQTNSKGEFSLKIKTGKIYTVEFEKAGYTSCFLTIDLIGVPKEVSNKGIAFNGAEIALNSFLSKNTTQPKLPFGKIFYNTNGNYVDFEPTKSANKKKKEEFSNPTALMLRSVLKNKTKLQTSKLEQKNIEKADSKQKEESSVLENNYSSKADSIFSALKQASENDFEQTSEEEIGALENNIKEAWSQLQKEKKLAQTPDEILAVAEKEQTLKAIERQLKDAKKIIEIQKSKISSQRLMLIFATASVLLLLGFLYLGFRYNREKKKTYLLLKEKNKKITDSINYASRIQESILPSDEEIKMLLPESFVYFQPRDIVSGDFYWISHKQEKTIIACVDCTGHGVPGAFMSLIGNTLLNHIVNEKQILNAAEILKMLNEDVLNELHQNTERAQSRDGMEMALCVIDKKAQTIDFAGAMNPLYIVDNGEVSVMKPNIKSIGGFLSDNTKTEFTSQIIPIKKGMSIYMFTDGYMDQFGGPENKKFNIQNFKQMLLGINHLEMKKQKTEVEQTIQKWQGDNKQIDDMLVMGIKF